MTRDELVAKVERHVRRGELPDAVELLEDFLDAHPDDEALRYRLQTVRELADPKTLRPRAKKPASPPLPADPVERLQALLARVNAHRKDR